VNFAPDSVSTVSIPAQGRVALLLHGLAASVGAHAILFVVPALYLITNEAMLGVLADPQRATWKAMIVSMATISLPAALITLFFVRLITYAFVIKPASPTAALIADTLKVLRSPQRFLNGLPVLIAMVVFNKAMLDLKPSIPALVPFTWDAAFMNLDRVLHLGRDPWIWLQSLLGVPYLSLAISFAYCFWFLAMFTFWFWFAFQDRYTSLRIRFFLTWMLTWWLGGGLMALYFSSAGPAYYGAIGLTPDPFAPLMAYLRQANESYPIWALDTQDMLWRAYSARDIPFLGISAFPSMHNATAAIIALAALKLHRGLGLALIVYGVLILVGSVHLGWHYAIDGYAGILIAVVAWWLSGPIVRFWDRTAWVTRYESFLKHPPHATTVSATATPAL
jgi:hypothetical protein